jgi:hypothetical protein
VIVTPLLRDWRITLEEHFPHRIVVPRLSRMVIDNDPGDIDAVVQDLLAWCALQYGPDGTGSFIVSQKSLNRGYDPDDPRTQLNPSWDRVSIDTSASWASRNWGFYFKDPREAVLFKFYAA